MRWRLRREADPAPDFRLKWRLWLLAERRKRPARQAAIDYVTGQYRSLDAELTTLALDALHSRPDLLEAWAAEARADADGLI